jgi:hypothetical protein
MLRGRDGRASSLLVGRKSGWGAGLPRRGSPALSLVSPFQALDPEVDVSGVPRRRIHGDYVLRCRVQRVVEISSVS